MCFLSSLIFAAGLMRLGLFFSFYVCISLSRQQPFYFYKEHKLMGEEKKKSTDLKNRCLKRAFLKLPIGEFALL